MDNTSTVSYLDSLEKIAVEVVRPAAGEIDQSGAFPRAAMDALSQGGLLGLISAPDVGGMGQGLRAAALVIERVAQECASTAMVLCMHYAGTAVIEAHGPLSVRGAIANGKHITTLAFSVMVSLSDFWTRTSTAAADDGSYHLKRDKCCISSDVHAYRCVCSGRQLAAEGDSTIWLVPAKTAGLSVAGPFNGLGLRGNASSPVNAKQVALERSAMLGQDGGGFDIMMSIVLPYFQIMNAAFSVGTMESATRKAAEHVAGTKFEHLGSGLSDLPTVRAYIARMRIKTDMARALLLDTLDAIEKGRADTLLRVLEVKAAAGEASTEVTDL